MCTAVFAPSATGLLAALLTTTAHAGVTVLIADRANNKVWRLTDANDDGTIQPTEISTWYDDTNASGTAAADNLNGFFASPQGDVIGGDQVNRLYTWMRDYNLDGDALDPGESRQIADTSNASGASTTFPAGGAFLPNGDILIVNAGNGFGVDAIYRCVDQNLNGTWNDAGDITQFVGDNPIAFGPGNGPYSPQEVWVSPTGIGFLRNSSANLHGVFRFQDLNANNRADDSTTEFKRWYTGTSAGFALEADSLRPGSLYYAHIFTGGVDQVFRLTDNSNDGAGDGDADDAGEAVMVYSTAEASFSAIDLLCLPNGDLLVTDNSTKRVLRLHDADNDGLFTTAGERTDFLAPGSIVGDIRQIVLIPTIPTCGSSDFNGDGDFGTDQDIEAFFACLAGNCCATCWHNGPDFNGDGDSGTDQDIEAFFRVLSGGNCS